MLIFTFITYIVLMTLLINLLFIQTYITFICPVQFVQTVDNIDVCLYQRTVVQFVVSDFFFILVDCKIFILSCSEYITKPYKMASFYLQSSLAVFNYLFV